MEDAASIRSPDLLSAKKKSERQSANGRKMNQG